MSEQLRCPSCGSQDVVTFPPAKRHQACEKCAMAWDVVDLVWLRESHDKLLAACKYAQRVFASTGGLSLEIVDDAINHAEGKTT